MVEARRGRQCDRTPLVIDRDGERLEFIAEHRLYGVHDVIRLLERAGFLRVAVFGDLAGRPLSAASDNAVFVATR